MCVIQNMGLHALKIIGESNILSFAMFLKSMKGVLNYLYCRSGYEPDCDTCDWFQWI